MFFEKFDVVEREGRTFIVDQAQIAVIEYRGGGLAAFLYGGPEPLGMIPVDSDDPDTIARAVQGYVRAMSSFVNAFMAAVEADPETVAERLGKASLN